MATTGSTSVNSLLRYPFIAGRFSRLAPIGQVMTNSYGIGLSATSNAQIATGATKRSNNRDIVYDIYDSSRLVAGFRAPGSGPAKRKRFPIGKQSATGVRVFNQMVFGYEELRNYRPQGSMPGTVDAGGKKYIASQVDNAIMEVLNTREYVFSRLLKGSLPLKVSGENYIPVAPADADMTVDYVPSTWKSGSGTSHTGQLPIGGSNGTTDVISTSWDDTSADIVGQLLELYSISMRLSGFPISEIWCNSVTWSHIINNTKLQAQGGSAFRVWETMTGKEQGTNLGEPNIPVPYFTRTLRSSGPQFKFHVYDGGIMLNTDVHNTTSSSSWHKFLDDGELIITPDFRRTDWFDLFDILETVQEGYGSQPKEVYGFHSWGRQEINNEVPQFVFNMLDNYCPTLTVPNAVFHPTVIFT